MNTPWHFRVRLAVVVLLVWRLPAVALAFADTTTKFYNLNFAPVC